MSFDPALDSWPNESSNLAEKTEMDRVVDAMKRIKRFKSGRTRQEVYGTISYQDGYVEDCKIVAEWYSFRAIPESA